ncbi:DUF2306 domain-containing protein [Yoonia vestfoldensis]|uniref:DUF2306 domain-containing protein n=1 Tax=Yoonia vestfoldensis TaxID=245188 RepID=UPI001FE191DE|nr:DUF2306 domain-containing protein [Yoonia vestfoldensis]
MLHLVPWLRTAILWVMGRVFLQTGGLLLVMLLAAPFAFYAAGFGQDGLRGTLDGPHYLLSENGPANAGIFSHMLLGALITLLVPLQLIRPLRARLPALHRWTGRLVTLAAGITALGGLAYIALRGTIGGAVMDAGFTLYGALMLLAAVQTYRHARARRLDQHNAWALRLFWLVLGSWLYRVHYGLWYLTTGGLWSTPAFTGAFDLVQNFAFYLPYLIGVEIYLRRRFSSPGRRAKLPA